LTSISLLIADLSTNAFNIPHIFKALYRLFMDDGSGRAFINIEGFSFPVSNLTKRHDWFFRLALLFYGIR
jgi:hypothetical protein